ncbi:Oidioi.mRNA.OKI2018_I69.PAR.g12035.t1.cds [Oikopleura dioica]|uniref:Oidioi.mRNA.OKI2018_I69.PAR.g12035.t1.cds n=1 Tax=Oikopleura dioica TaxID=34765 RepID=A0ABN7RYG1_OIKDI|nr:Oidioi.mRNA.OKI2018_I69.PAR.g12035.t1.cds [Oikopleura dioica]
MSQDLQRYVSSGKITKLKSFLDQGNVDIDERLPNGWTALHRATEENKVKMMKTLIDYNASVDAKTDAGFTPLMLGVQSGNLEAIRLLVAHNADVNAQNGYQATPLMLAAAEGKLSIIQFLLKSGADPELKDYRKQTAADWAEERGNHEVISYLTKYAQDQHGSLTKNEIAEIMKQHENTGMGKKRNSRSSSLQPKKDSLFPADLSKIDENKEVTADDLKLGLSIGGASSSKLHRPSEVSIVSNFGETDYLQLHSTITSLQDRIAELELRVKTDQDLIRRLERVESRLGINEMMTLVERNRQLEEKIRTLEIESKKNAETTKKETKSDDKKHSIFDVMDAEKRKKSLKERGASLFRKLSMDS